MKVIDLSLPLGESTPVYRDARGYSDPPTRLSAWVEIGESVKDGSPNPYRVTCVEMGLHTGTHIDSPSHFHLGGKAVGDLSPDSLIGRAVVVDWREGEVFDAVSDGARAPGSIPLLLLSEDRGLTLAAAREIIGWGRPVVASAGPIDSAAEPDCPRASLLLGAGVFLVVELDSRRAAEVTDGDLLVVAPLPLIGVEGAPCRVFALRDD